MHCVASTLKQLINPIYRQRVTIQKTCPNCPTRQKGTPMIDMEMKRELMAFGAYLADTDGIYGIRDRLTSADFIDNDLAKCIEEMENVTSGKTRKEDMRFLPFLLESLRCPNGGKAIDGIEQAVKSNAETKRFKKLCFRGALASSSDDINRIKKQFQTV